MRFALVSRTKGGWLGLGVSEDGRMVGSSAVIGYPLFSSFGSPIRHMLLAGKSASQFSELPMDSFSSSRLIQDGDRTIIMFTRPREAEGLPSITDAGSVYLIWARGPAADAYARSEGSFSFSGSHNWRMLQQDPNSYQGVTLLRHVFRDSRKIDFVSKHADHGLVAYKKIHAILMAGAYVLLLPLGILLHQWTPSGLGCRHSVSLQLTGLALQIVGMVVSMIGLLLALVKIKTSQSMTIAHKIIGVFLMLLTILQVIHSARASSYKRADKCMPLEPQTSFALCMAVLSLAFINVALGIVISGLPAWVLVLYILIAFGTMVPIVKSGSLMLCDRRNKKHDSVELEMKDDDNVVITMKRRTSASPEKQNFGGEIPPDAEKDDTIPTAVYESRKLSTPPAVQSPDTLMSVAPSPSKNLQADSNFSSFSSSLNKGMLYRSASASVEKSYKIVSSSESLEAVNLHADVKSVASSVKPSKTNESHAHTSTSSDTPKSVAVHVPSSSSIPDLLPILVSTPKKADPAPLNHPSVNCNQ